MTARPTKGTERQVDEITAHMAAVVIAVVAVLALAAWLVTR